MSLRNTIYLFHQATIDNYILSLVYKNLKLMKNIILALILVGASVHAHSQYHPMLDSSHTWLGKNYGLIVTPFRYFIGADVIQDAIPRKTLWAEFEGQEPFLYALLTEDTLNQLVYWTQGDTEILLYNFNLQVGEQASVYGVGDIHLITVTEVTSVQVNNTARKKIVFTEEQGGGGYWIEGIGSVYGVPDAALGLILDFYPQVTCFYEGNNLAWDNPDIIDSDCGLTLSTTEIHEQSFNVYPNPTHNNIQLTIPAQYSSLPLNAKLYNMTGELVLEQTLSNNQINLEALPGGLYAFQLSAGNTQLGTARVIKE
jgi:hypothetical protein